MAPFKIGQKVRVSVKHWLRAKEMGQIVEFDPDPGRNNHWLVAMPDRGPGKGLILEDGRQGLWFDDSQIEKVTK